MNMSEKVTRLCAKLNTIRKESEASLKSRKLQKSINRRERERVFFALKSREKERIVL